MTVEEMRRGVVGEEDMGVGGGVEGGRDGGAMGCVEGMERCRKWVEGEMGG